jgi:hypothetical protein
MTHQDFCQSRLCARVASLALSAISLLAACGDQVDGTGGTAVSVGARLGSAPAEASEALVTWVVTSGQPDYSYVWGRAAVEGDSLQIVLRSRPPADALNKYGLGVGMILVAPRAAGLRDGMQSEADEHLFDQISGASERHAIIYVDHDQANAYIDSMSSGASAGDVERAHEHWLFDFPQGYSCGEGRAAVADQGFDHYVPVDCSKVQVRLGDIDDFEFPNWT